MKQADGARPRNWKKRVAPGVLFLLLFASGIIFFALPVFVEKHYNRTIHSPPYPVSQST